MFSWLGWVTFLSTTCWFCCLFLYYCCLYFFYVQCRCIIAISTWGKPLKSGRLTRLTCFCSCFSSTSLDIDTFHISFLNFLILFNFDFLIINPAFVLAFLSPCRTLTHLICKRRQHQCRYENYLLPSLVVNGNDLNVKLYSFCADWVIKSWPRIWILGFCSDYCDKFQ